jgi:uncharacterized protein YdhG (YjbR/CyaY superfamily)
MKKPSSFSEYLSAFPPKAQKYLKQMRALVKKNAPAAQEVISYGMPAFKQNGMLLYFAAHKNHIGLYPMASGIKHFEKELKNYQTSRGTVQFPFNKPLPAALIARIIRFRVKENVQKEEMKRSNTR